MPKPREEEHNPSPLKRELAMRRAKKLAAGEMCNDCAFLADSPEQAHDPVTSTSIVEQVIHQARAASTIFWCHKPFLEPQQQWGYDPKTLEITPLMGEHWRACGGWCKAFDKKWSVPTKGSGDQNVDA